MTELGFVQAHQGSALDPRLLRGFRAARLKRAGSIQSRAHHAGPRFPQRRVIRQNARSAFGNSRLDSNIPA